MFNQDDFFEILSYLKDGEVNTNIPPEVRQLAQNAKVQTTNFFEHAIDQIAFNSKDVNRLRRMLIDWYSSNRALQDMGKGTSDAFSLPSKMLDKACASFGFPLARGIYSKVDKALFLYTLTQLYKIKGTPRSIKSALEFFGVYNIQIFEWWLKKDKVLNNLYFQSSYVDLGGVNPETLQAQKIPYTHLNLDPHWWYSEQQIYDLNETLPINLPSITPYFSIEASASIDRLNVVYAMISRKIGDQYNGYVNNNILDKTIYVDAYGQNLSLLELVLGIGYTYNTWTGRTHGSDDENYIYYTGTESENEVIIDEYNQIVKRPSSRTDQKEKQNQYRTKFTQPQLNDFIQSAGDTAAKLDFVNADFKTWIDTKALTIEEETIYYLRQLLKELDIYVRMELGMQALSFEQMMLGTGNDDIFAVINFFKPKRARLLSFNLVYAVDDELFNSILLEDTLFNRIRQWDKDTQNIWDKLNHTKITQWDYEFLREPPDSGLVPGSLGFDTGNFFDRGTLPWVNLKDELYQIIRQWDDDNLVRLTDHLQIPFIRMWFNEFGRPADFDRGGQFDISLMQAWDHLSHTKITHSFNDILYRPSCRKAPFDMGGVFDLCPGSWIGPDGYRNKRFDTGFIFDVDGYPIDKTFDNKHYFDDGEGYLFVPWWTEGLDPDKCCACDIVNTSIKQKETEYINKDDSLSDTMLHLLIKDSFEKFSGFDLNDHFDEAAKFFRDHLSQRLLMIFNDTVMDSIRGFDLGHTFDIYSTLMKDVYVQSVVEKIGSSVDMTSKLNIATSLKFNDVFEPTPGFDIDFDFDSISPYFRDVVKQKYYLTFKEDVVDSIKFFDEIGHTFDIYATLLKDNIQIIVNAVPPP